MSTGIEFSSYDLFEKVFQFLSFQDIVKLRRVSRSVKVRADQWLASVTQLNVNPPGWTIYMHTVTDHGKVPPNLIFFRRNNLMKTLISPISRPMMSFLALCCPNLQVFVAVNDTLPLECLHFLGKKLEYFAVYSVVDFTQSKKFAPFQLPPMFPVLQAFDIEKNANAFCHKMFHSQRQSSFLQWTHPCKHRCRCGFGGKVLPVKAKSLGWYMKTPLDLSTIDSTLAESLQVLHAYKIVVTGPCNRFPNLRSINNRPSLAPLKFGPVIDVLDDSSDLRHLHLVGKSDANVAGQLSKLSGCCKLLQTFTFNEGDNYEKEFYGTRPFVFELGPHMEDFKMVSSIPLVLKNCASSTLRTLDLSVPLLGEQIFEFPNLRCFFLIFRDSRPNMSWLFESLNNSLRLQRFHLVPLLPMKLHPSSVQKLIQLLENSQELVHVEVFIRDNDDEEGPRLTFNFDQSRYPRLQECSISMPSNISVKLLDTFDRLEIRGPQLLSCHSARKEFHLSNVVQLHLDQKVEHLKAIHYFEWEELDMKGDFFEKTKHFLLQEKTELPLSSSFVSVNPFLVH